MAAELKINDSSTWRTITKVEVNDGGTWRTIQDIKVNDGGTWRTVFQYALLSATLTPADVNLPPSVSGYDNGNIATYGSISNAALVGGQTLTAIFDDNDSGTSALYIAAASDPGASLFSSITVNGVNKTSASNIGYGYAGGVATWTWSGTFSLSGASANSLLIFP